MHSRTTEEFLDDLADFDDAMLVTRDGAFLRSRPMAVYVDTPDRTIRFLTSVRTHKVDEVERNPDANVVFTDDDNWISVSGPIRVSRDRGDIDAIWSSTAEAWLKDGKAEAIVLILEPQIAEYWDRSDNVLKTGWEMVKGTLSDSPPDIGDNRKLSF